MEKDGMEKEKKYKSNDSLISETNYINGIPK